MGILKKTLFYSVLFIGAITFLYPFIWMILATFKPEIEITELTLLPSEFTLRSYELVFNKIPIIRSFLNSLFVSLTATASVLFFSSMVGYSLSRLEYRGRELIFGVILLTMMIPAQITLIPMYILMVKLELTNTYRALIFPASISAFGILLFRQYFKSFPQEIIDAARIDGAGEFTILYRIIWPNSIPTLITVGIITFMGIWNDVLWPLIVIKKESLMTMPQMVTLFSVGGRAEAQLGAVLAAATLLAVPVMLIYLFFQKYFIRSMATSGLKN
ncbi:MAG: carbohydrate ABC transporter permease [Candidatus Marinimicrobia bacterium]|nr:carbohydrate ABC transporter permease [Candidatus Neomarinimicrobiota bacterium]MCH7955497.1 carbohydrate ABC transporter permease [Candidatus Neomarinimicrobiota bacterium]